MKSQLKELLWKYITEHNPELMFSLQENYAVHPYLNEKINSILPQLKSWKKIGYPDPAICILGLEVLTLDLKPSRFHFISKLLEHEFPEQFCAYKDQGVLAYQTLAIVDLCQEAFDSIQFCESHYYSERFKDAICGIIRNEIGGDYSRICRTKVSKEEHFNYTSEGPV